MVKVYIYFYYFSFILIITKLKKHYFRFENILFQEYMIYMKNKSCLKYEKTRFIACLNKQINKLFVIR